MTPEEAEQFYYKGANAEYDKHKADYKPVNQRKTVLAGFQAVIDAVRSQVDAEYAMRYLNMSDPQGQPSATDWLRVGPVINPDGANGTDSVKVD